MVQLPLLRKIWGPVYWVWLAHPQIFNKVMLWAAFLLGFFGFFRLLARCRGPLPKVCTVYVEIFDGIYFHYFSHLKGFVIMNSICSVLLSSNWQI